MPFYYDFKKLYSYEEINVIELQIKKLKIPCMSAVASRWKAHKYLSLTYSRDKYLSEIFSWTFRLRSVAGDFRHPAMMKRTTLSEESYDSVGER